MRHYGNIILLLFVAVEHLVWSVAGYQEKITLPYTVTAEVLNLGVLIAFCYNMMARRHTELGLFIIVFYSIASIILLAAQMIFPAIHMHVFESGAEFSLTDFCIFAAVHISYLVIIAVYFRKKREEYA